MSASLTNNFFLNSRGLTFGDTASVTWALNKNTNVLTATVAGTPSGANPTASVGLTAVNGSATTFMRSDAAPALSQAIAPTWSGLHTFSAGLTISAGAFTLNTHTLTLTANASLSGTNTGDQVIPAAANPSSGVGLAVVNGSATTFMRSDGAPALSQAIVPTWSGLHTFGAGITVSAGSFTLNAHTLTLTATASVGGTNTGDQTLPVSANPTGTVGLAVVNGSATTFMRSDGAPALSQAIVPTWSAQHAFAAGLGITGAITTLGVSFSTLDFTANTARYISFGPGTTSIGQISLITASSDASVFKNAFSVATSAGAQSSITIGNSTDKAPVTINGAVGVNGNSPPAQSTGWGTPTGGTVVASFAAGATPSLLQLSEAVAQLIVVLKQVGTLGA